MSGTLDDGPRPANVVALEFEKDFKTEENGSQREVHWVTWAKRGDLHYNQVRIEVSRLSKPRVGQGGREEFSPVWLAIKPHYDAWLAGTMAPTHGTALESWPALNKRQLKAFKDAGYKTIEDVAAMMDSDIQRVRMPDVRKMRTQAEAYLENQKGSAHIEAAMAQRDAEIEALKAQLADMTRVLEDVTTPKTDKVEVI